MTTRTKAVVMAQALVVLAIAGAASAHDLDGPIDAPPGWTLDPWIVLPLMTSAALFAIGWVRLASRSRKHDGRWPRRAALFGAGWIVVAIALVSPLHEAGERSFALHMIEHEALMLLAAPLLVLAEPLVVLLWALPSPARRGIGRLVTTRGVTTLWTRATEPVTATALQAVALWAWHAPVLFDLALADPGWHAAQHLAFFVTALLFWTAMLPRPSHPVMAGRGVAALCLFITSIVSGALGALMAVSQSPWYAGYARLAMAPFGLTPAEDQQLAGLLMWIPGGLVHAGAALLLLRGLFTTRPVIEDGIDAA